ncbi:hypothetical protein [Paraburkholderia tropica]|uniref:hypothetical protein n=1 Tax=Paraburkholderia tropica TaxID=92647 RepID=UPI002AB6A7D7|nr:hypothetical protein [Paraburkholderia tropica]
MQFVSIVETDEDIIALAGTGHHLIFPKIETVFGSRRMLPPSVVPGDFCSVSDGLPPQREDGLSFKALLSEYLLELRDTVELVLMGLPRVSFGCREQLDTGAPQDNWSIAHLPSPRQQSPDFLASSVCSCDIVPITGFSIFKIAR